MFVRLEARHLGRAALAAVLAALLIVPAAAETRSKKVVLADSLVKEALHREIYGLAGDREALLSAALEKIPEYAPAMWQSGYVQHHGKWVKHDEVPAILARDSRMDAYHHLRKQAEDTPAAHLGLARWCEDKKLTDQERAHLTRVVELDPDNATARDKLGFDRVAGLWVSRDAQAQAQNQVEQAAARRLEWDPKIEEIRSGLGRRGLMQREAAAQRLEDILDPAAIDSIEAMLSTLDEKTALSVVQTFSRMPGHEASLALSRQAVFSPWATVRKAATDRLKTRPEQDFIPALLTALYCKVQSKTELYEAPDGSLVYRHSLFREGQEHNQLAVFETAYRNQSSGDAGDALADAVLDMNVKALSREAATSRQNAFTAALNQRIMEVLGAVTGDKIRSQPDDWWAWWYEHNEVYAPTDKPVVGYYGYDEVTYVDPPSGGGGGSGGGSTMECLAAGTLVWTDVGPKRIEEMEVGDLVLAQDPDTGKLAYKPVLRTTIRPASQLVRIEAGGESITTSGGHLFWVAGDGWQRSRVLKSGAELHAIDGTVRISQLEQAGFEPSYNLIVADFHSYFVGQSKILSHDNTVPRPTRSVVPGLADY